VDNVALGLFILSATALLGSPGPAIAMLVAIGRAEGIARGLRFFTGLQIGLALAAAISAFGLFSLVQLVPGAMQVMAVGAAIYLLWLAWKIASAPVGVNAGEGGVLSSFTAGMFLGLSNPKAFMAFLSLFASQTLVAGSRHGDTVFKWALVVLVMIVVDIVWLMIGAGLRHARLSPRGERALNIVLGAMVVGATLLSLW